MGGDGTMREADQKIETLLEFGMAMRHSFRL